MKVIVSEENRLEFDNGLSIIGEHSQICCEYNYLDFEQLPVGTDLPDQDATDFIANISIQEDGFMVRDSKRTPLWVQARSEQNGYYSNEIGLKVSDKFMTLVYNKANQESGEPFDGKLNEV